MSLTIAAFAAGCDDGGGGTAGSAGSAGDGGSGGNTGGSSTGGSGGGPTTEAVSLTFKAVIGAEDFDCANSYTGLGTGADDAKISDFRLYVHDVALIAGGTAMPVTLDQDGVWQYENVALLDFENGTASCSNGTVELNTVLKGKVTTASTPGEYDGISFKLGVPFELNHADAATAPSPLNLSALFWSWNGGYKFLRVDSLATGAAMSFNLHLGSTECQDDGSGGVSSCAKPNRPEIALSGKNPLQTTILVDYKAVIADSDIAANAGGAPGCMSGATDPECASIFEKLGLDIQTGAPKEGQQLFLFDPNSP